MERQRRTAAPQEEEEEEEAGRLFGGGAAARRLVTAIRFRKSDCRLSSEDVTYPSAGILLLNFSKLRPRGERRWGRWGSKKKTYFCVTQNITQKYRMRSFLKSIRGSSCQ